jgi:ABC-2 type transport system ATP-binding protein
MKNDIIISVQNLSKHFRLYHDKPLTLKERVLHLRSRRYDIFKALDNVSFDIHRGETLGIIGRNGSGKSTILKIISSIIYPNSGTLVVDGRVSSLLELGAGFHPDFSGLENIYTNASIFGLTKKQIDSRLDTIIDFSELSDFMNNPVRTYSSGMYMRLAFSVAINVEADILLIDEILAVGDSNFQQKCFQKLADIQKTGITIVIVTHDLSTIRSLSNRVIWINDGKIAADGAPDEVIAQYKNFMDSL